MKSIIKPSPLVFPAPAALVSCGDMSLPNIITISWIGNINSAPPMCSISVRPERFSYHLIKESGEFVVNLPTKELLKAVDWCGLKSGKDLNKFLEMGLTPVSGKFVNAPIIKESPVNIECKVKNSILLGTHEMFLAEIVGVQIDSEYVSEKNTISWNSINHVVYCAGYYMDLGEVVAKNGFSLR